MGLYRKFHNFKYAEALLVVYGGGGALVAKSCPTLETL